MLFAIINFVHDAFNNLYLIMNIERYQVGSKTVTVENKCEVYVTVQFHRKAQIMKKLVTKNINKKLQIFQY